MIRITRHPIMWGLMLWAAAHVLARRAELKAPGVLRQLPGSRGDRHAGDGPQEARETRTGRASRLATSHIPFVAIAQGRNRLVWSEIGWKRPLIGLVAFVVFLAAHPWSSARALLDLQAERGAGG